MFGRGRKKVKYSRILWETLPMKSRFGRGGGQSAQKELANEVKVLRAPLNCDARRTTRVTALCGRSRIPIDYIDDKRIYKRNWNVIRERFNKAFPNEKKKKERKRGIKSKKKERNKKKKTIPFKLHDSWRGLRTPLHTNERSVINRFYRKYALLHARATVHNYQPIIYEAFFLHLETKISRLPWLRPGF